MSLFLQHYFDPQKQHLHITPRPGAHKKTDLYNLGYVQNVSAGQCVAELLPRAAIEQSDVRYLRRATSLPVGPNTHIDPQAPHRLLASKKGYVSYEDDKITVKTILNVPSNVDFHTGNIYFVGDTSIAKDVRAGFSVHGEKVLIKGMVEGGHVHAKTDLAIIGGVRGSAGKKCVLVAGNTMRLAFAEKTEIQCGSTIFLTKYSLHSTMYAGGNVVIQGRLMGGTLHAYGSVLITKELGNKAQVPTYIYLGYPPHILRKIEKADAHMARLSEKIYHMASVAGHLPPHTNTVTRMLARLRMKHAAFTRTRDYLWNTMHIQKASLEHCRVVVPGDVFPGVEIAIGQAYYRVEEPCKSVIFFLEDDTIVMKPYTPPPSQTAG